MDHDTIPASAREWSMRLEIPGLPPINSARGGSWRARLSEQQRWQRTTRACLVTVRLPREPLPFARVELTRRSSVESDGDNLAESFKPVLDALRGIVIVDDAPRYLEGGAPIYRWQRAAPRRGSIEIVVVKRKPVPAESMCPHCGGPLPFRDGPTRAIADELEAP